MSTLTAASRPFQTPIRSLRVRPSVDTMPHLAVLAARTELAPCTLGADVPVEAPLPSSEGEWVWRPGYGWVERTVAPFELDVPEMPHRETAAAA